MVEILTQNRATLRPRCRPQSSPRTRGEEFWPLSQVGPADVKGRLIAHPDEELLDLYAVRRLHGVHALDVEAHLKVCRSCCVTVATSRWILECFQLLRSTHAS
jgi:hypothetical protein